MAFEGLTEPRTVVVVIVDTAFVLLDERVGAVETDAAVSMETGCWAEGGGVGGGLSGIVMGVSLDVDVTADRLLLLFPEGGAGVKFSGREDGRC